MADTKESQNQGDAQQLFQVMITQHYNLQSARASTVAEANGRAGLFLTALSSGLVALAFIGQRADMGQAFLLFALVLLPTLMFIGLATFVRLLEVSMEDVILLRGIVRIHHYYAEIAPQVKPYLVVPIHDDWAGMRQSFGLMLPRGQLLLTAPGMISVVNGILAGSFTGLVSAAFLPTSLLIDTVLGTIVFLLTVLLQTRVQLYQRKLANAHIGTLFPSPTKAHKTSTSDY